MYSSIDPFIAMVYRQIKRWWSNRTRVVSIFLNSFLWMIFLGLGISTVLTFTPTNIELFSKFSTNTSDLSNLREMLANYIQKMINSRFGGLDYATFMVSGIAVMAVFMGSFISGLTVIWDKQFGFLKESLVAPAPRGIVIAGRAIGDAIVNTLNGLIIMSMGFIVSQNMNPLGAITAIPYLFLTSLTFTSLGIAIALRLSSAEGFHMIVNAINMPIVFISGVFYPVTTMPSWMKTIAIFNPLSYSIHSIRYLLTSADIAIEPMNILTDFIILLATASITMIYVSKIFERTTTE